MSTRTIIPLRSAQLGATRLTSLASTISPHSSNVIPPRVISCSELHLAISDVGIALCYQDKDDATVTESVVATWPPVKGKKIIDPLNPSTLFNPKKPATAIHGLSIVYQPAAMDVHIGGMVPPHMRIGIEWHDRVDAKIEGTSTKLIHIQAAMETQYLTKLEAAMQPYVMTHNVAKLLRRGVSRWATNKYTNPYYTAPIRTLLKISSILIETAFIICLLVELYAHMPRVITFFISGFFNWIHATGDQIIQYFISLYMPYHDAHPIFSTLALLIACTMTLPVLMPIVVAFGICYGLSHFTVQIVLALTAAQHVVTILMQTRKTYKLMLLYANMAYGTIMFILKKGKGGGVPRAAKAVSTAPTTNTTASTTSINSSSASIASAGEGLKSE